MDVWTTLHAARGEVYDQRSGPVAPAGGGVVGHTARANLDMWTRVSVPGVVYPGCG